MTPDRWAEVRQMIQNNFVVRDEYVEELDPGTAEVVEFEKDGDLFKLSFHRQPRVLGKDTKYSRRGGSDVKVTYRYSPDEETYHITLERYDGDKNEWVPVRAAGIFQG